MDYPHLSRINFIFIWPDYSVLCVIVIFLIGGNKPAQKTSSVSNHKYVIDEKPIVYRKVVILIYAVRHEIRSPTTMKLITFS